MAERAALVRHRGSAPAWLVSLLIALGILAAVPVAGFAWDFLTAEGQDTQTPFASAPAGNYVVVARIDETTNEDVISVVPAGDPAGAMEVARVPHLPGYLSRGAVSPDGTKVALVVADAGTVGRPGGSLLTIDLNTGGAYRLAIEVDVLQDPVWTPDGMSVVITRSSSTDTPTVDVTISAVAADLSGETVLAAAQGVFGAYPVGFAGADLVWVAIGGDGSVAQRGASSVALGSNFTRDWALSPDGTQLAFVEVLATDGVRYEPRIASLDGSAVAGSAVGADDGLQANGAAWQPTTGIPVFGSEAGVGAAGVSGGSGIDVPRGWAPDGSALFVQSWSGASFDEPGVPVLAVVTAAGQTDLPGYQAFFGWAVK